MPTASVRLALGERAYSIVVADSSSVEFVPWLKKSALTSRCVVVTQPGIWKALRPRVDALFAACGVSYDLFEAPEKPSEKAKTAAVLMRLVDRIAKAEASGGARFVVAVGGGVVGDLAGFAASIYKRGIPLIQYPTTLTAQVDSAIGGKNAVDMPCAKNALGSIYQPKFVFCDIGALKSMPDAAFRDGLAEVIKYGMIRSVPFLTYLEKNISQIVSREPRILKEVVLRCARIKADYVVRDEKDDKGLRAQLNFGHTFGHAMEAAFGFEFTHGKAVAVGMMAAMALAHKLGRLKDEKLPRRLELLLTAAGLPTRIAFNPAEKRKMLSAMRFDKKWIQGKSRFVIVEKAGVCRVVTDVTEEAAGYALDFVCDLQASRKSKQAGSARPVNPMKWIGSMLRRQKGSGSRKPIGKIIKFYPKISVAIVRVERGVLSVGDVVRVTGSGGFFDQPIESIQENHQAIPRATKGMVVGIRVHQPANESDLIFKSN